MSLITDNNVIQYILVYHNNIERVIPSFENGLKEQEDIDKHQLFSCILMIKDDQRVYI
jgi:hypothetical protein